MCTPSHNMRPLPVEILPIASRVVDIPHPINPVQLRRPDVAAPCRVGVGPDDFCLSRLEAFESFGASEAEVSPRCRHEVVEAVMVDDVGVGTVAGTDRVGEGCCGGYLQQAQGCEEKAEEAHGCGWEVDALSPI